MNALYRTMLFVPGNDPGKMVKAEIYQPDCIIYDLEDAVTVSEKDAARILVRHALRELQPDCRVGVRVNPLHTPFGLADVAAVAPLAPDFIRLPKAESADQIQRLDHLLTRIEEQEGLAKNGIKIVATIETALGVLRAHEIAAAPRMLAVGLGAEDFCTDMKTARSADSAEIALARAMIVMAAHAAGILAMDVVYSRIQDEAGFRKDVKIGKQLGYTGKSVVHPAQIGIVHELYAPSTEEIMQAKEILAAYKQASAEASGVISLHGKMIDAPMVTRARYILDYAKASGIEVEEP